MGDRKFRFGVVAAPRDGASWRQDALRFESLGYSTLLMPDGLQLPSVTGSLAMAAEATTELRVGTFVMASALRPPRMIAYEASSLTVLTDGRFELGIGTGNPTVLDQATSELGYAETSGRQRLAMAGEAIDHLRELDGQRRTPVLMAAGGPKARALAAQRADSITVAAGPLAGDKEYAAATEHIREQAGARADEIELSMNVFVVGDEVPAEIATFMGVDARSLIEHGALTMLRGDVTEMADELQRRRDAFGTSYITVNSGFAEAFAPVIERLRGR